jgi:serine/threonine-protein kinase
MTFQEDKLKLPQNQGFLASGAHLDVSIGSIVNDRYLILSLLGEGGMGVAYKAMDNQFNQPVVLKFLLPHRFANAKDISRFEREAKTASRLSHPGIVKVIDFAVLADEQPYLVMEFLDGQTLAQRIEAEGQLPVDETIDIFIQICDALAYAHAMGILHLDIKPSNIMLTTDSGSARAKLLDFGMAKFIDGEETPRQKITQTNELVGSPFYMSPEQARKLDLDARSDLYSLGCTIYEALTGGPPHLGQTSIATLLKRETDQPLALSEASLGRHFSDLLEQLVLKLLKTNPDQRFQSAREVKQELERIKTGGSVTSKTSVQKPLTNVQASPRIHSYYYALIAFACLATLFIAIRFILKPSKHEKTIQHRIEAESPDLVDKGIGALETRYKSADLNEIGYKCLLNNNATEALSAYKECVALYERYPIRSKDKYADALSGLAYSYFMVKNYPESAKALERALEQYKSSHGEMSREFALIDTAIGCNFVLLNPKDVQHAFQVAKPLFERSITIQAKLPDARSTDIATLLGEQGNACITRGLLNEAYWRLEKAAKLFRSSSRTPTDSFFLALALAGLADFYSQTAQYDRVPPLCQELTVLFSKLGSEHQGMMATQFLRVADITRLSAAKSADPLNALRRSERAYEADLNFYLKVPGHNLKEIASIYDHLGTVARMKAKFGEVKQPDLAKQWDRKAILIRQAIAKPQPPTSGPSQ